MLFALALDMIFSGLIPHISLILIQKLGICTARTLTSLNPQRFKQPRQRNIPLRNPISDYEDHNLRGILRYSDFYDF